MLVVLDRSPGSLGLAAVADERTAATWPTWVDERLKRLGTGGLSLGSDRAKALSHRADTGWACLRMPDCFHGTHAIRKRSSLALGRHRRQAHQALTKAPGGPGPPPGTPPRGR
jgi:hypothetical protein